VVVIGFAIRLAVRVGIDRSEIADGKAMNRRPAAQ
jgi:hypothetical protein